MQVKSLEAALEEMEEDVEGAGHRAAAAEEKEAAATKAMRVRNFHHMCFVWLSVQNIMTPRLQS